MNRSPRCGIIQFVSAASRLGKQNCQSRTAAHRNQQNMEAYRSGHNEPHSKCGCPFRARGFESHRFRQAKRAPIRVLFSLLANAVGYEPDGRGRKREPPVEGRVAHGPSRPNGEAQDGRPRRGMLNPTAAQDHIREPVQKSKIRTRRAWVWWFLMLHRWANDTSFQRFLQFVVSFASEILLKNHHQPLKHLISDSFPERWCHFISEVASKTTILCS